MEQEKGKTDKTLVEEPLQVIILENGNVVFVTQTPELMEVVQALREKQDEETP